MITQATRHAVLAAGKALAGNMACMPMRAVAVGCCVRMRAVAVGFSPAAVFGSCPGLLCTPSTSASWKVRFKPATAKGYSHSAR